MPFFATMPITMIRPMNDATLKVVRVTSSARNTPTVESSAEDRIAIGAAKARETRTAARRTPAPQPDQHEQQDRGRTLLLLVSPAVLHANRRRQLQVATDLLHRSNPAAQVTPFQSGGDFDFTLQIFPADLRLPG